MCNKTVKVFLCLLVIGVAFAGVGCTGRAADRDGGSAATPTPKPSLPPEATNAPAATATLMPSSTTQPTQSPASPSPTAQPSGASNYTTTLGLDDVFFSGGDEEYGYPEDTLPTPEMPQ